MTAGQEADSRAIEAAKRAGWFLDTKLNKWRHAGSSALYCATPRWGRYACEDHGINY